MFTVNGYACGLCNCNGMYCPLETRGPEQCCNIYGNQWRLRRRGKGGPSSSVNFIKITFKTFKKFSLIDKTILTILID
jgi:hypothetical protein